MTAADQRQSKLATKQTLSRAQKKPVLKRIVRLSRQETLRLILYQRKRQNSAGANRRGGEEGAHGETCAARCQRGGILKRQSLSSSSVIPSLHSPKCLNLIFLCPSSSWSPHIRIGVTGAATKTPICVC